MNEKSKTKYRIQFCKALALLSVVFGAIYFLSRTNFTTQPASSNSFFHQKQYFDANVFTTPPPLTPTLPETPLPTTEPSKAPSRITPPPAPDANVIVPVHQVKNCHFEFVEYQSSQLEKHWHGIAERFDNTTLELYCEEATKFTLWADTWISLVRELMNNKLRALPITDRRYEEASKLFSKFFHREKCTTSSSSSQEETTNGELRETWIEPLAFTLRDPRWPCNSTIDYIMSREYLLLDMLDKKPTHSQNFLFDLGASTFNDGLGGPSQRWFYNNYKNRSIEFDRILLWEGKQVVPSDLFNDVPDDWLPGYQYFNILASVNETDRRNPLNIMKKIAKSTDFVTFKLDIDNGPAEISLVEQMQNRPEISSVIDEFFFEHHVSFQPILWAWGETYDRNATLVTSYDLFLELRKIGIRAHGWP